MVFDKLKGGKSKQVQDLLLLKSIQRVKTIMSRKLKMKRKNEYEESSEILSTVALNDIPPLQQEKEPSPIFLLQTPRQPNLHHHK